MGEVRAMVHEAKSYAADHPDAKTEVECDEIVEVERVDRAMYAIGRVLCHAKERPNKKMRIHLYGDGKPHVSFFEVCADLTRMIFSTAAENVLIVDF